MNNVKTMHDVEALEERLQMVKWTIKIGAPRRRQAVSTTSRIVSRTAGLLGKHFPSGVTYERRLRQTWTQRLRRLGL